MTLDVSPGTIITVDGYPYRVEEHSALHDIDFRLDLVRIAGPTPAHERWVASVLDEPHLIFLQPLAQEWLATPVASFVHEGELFVRLYRGSATRVRRTRSGSRSKDARVEYALFRSNSGRVILTIACNDGTDAWIGATLPPGAIEWPAKSA